MIRNTTITYCRPTVRKSQKTFTVTNSGLWLATDLEFYIVTCCKRQATYIYLCLKQTFSILIWRPNEHVASKMNTCMNDRRSKRGYLKPLLRGRRIFALISVISWDDYRSSFIQLFCIKNTWRDSHMFVPCNCLYVLFCSLFLCFHLFLNLS